MGISDLAQRPTKELPELNDTSGKGKPARFAFVAAHGIASVDSTVAA
jgi:hypothetical protein